MAGGYQTALVVRISLPYCVTIRMPPRRFGVTLQEVENALEIGEPAQEVKWFQENLRPEVEKLVRNVQLL